MNEELTAMKFDTLEKNIETLKKGIEEMPDAISSKIETSVNLKIENAMQKVKLDFYKWLVPVILGLLINAVGVIFSYLRG